MSLAAAVGWPRFILLGLACLLLAACQPAQDPASLEFQVRQAFRELKSLDFMDSGKTYTVSMEGAMESGPKEHFLRRRTAEEILPSGLSSGCGDHVRVFIARMEANHIEALMIDAAELSPRSWESRFAGHAVAAVRKPGTQAPWWLVDPTARRVLSKDWDPASPSFEANGKQFWIGFIGPAGNYPAHNARQLRDFYDRTLQSVPQAILDSEIFSQSP